MNAFSIKLNVQAEDSQQERKGGRRHDKEVIFISVNYRFMVTRLKCFIFCSNQIYLTSDTIWLLTRLVKNNQWHEWWWWQRNFTLVTGSHRAVYVSCKLSWFWFHCLIFNGAAILYTKLRFDSGRHEDVNSWQCILS